MKKHLPLIAVLLLLALHTTNVIRSYKYYGQMIGDISLAFETTNNFYHAIQNSSYLLISLLELILIGFYLAGSAIQKQKAYKLLRYLVVIGCSLEILWVGYFYAVDFEFLLRLGTGKMLLQVGLQLFFIGLSILFLVAKPANQPEGVDLNQYDLVNYTTKGHRFIHYLVDMLYLLPSVLFWSNSGPGIFRENSILLSILIGFLYMYYYFLSEWLFRQTLGKIATGSCVATIGKKYTGGRIFLRTLARRIPFDAVSFLFNANWHDSTSGTAVVYMNTWEKAFEEKKEEDETVTAEELV